MKHIILSLAAFMLIFTFPVITYASDLPLEAIAPATFSDGDSDKAIVSSAALDLQDADAQELLLDKLEVIIHLLSLIFAACLFQIFAIIAKLFGWIFTSIYKEIL